MPRRRRSTAAARSARGRRLSRQRAGAGAVLAGAELSSEFVAIRALHPLDALVGAEVGVLGHIRGILARLRVAAKTFRQRADMVRTGAAADTQVTHAHRIGSLAEFVYFCACADKRIQPNGEGSRIAAAGI